MSKTTKKYQTQIKWVDRFQDVSYCKTYALNNFIIYIYIYIYNTP